MKNSALFLIAALSCTALMASEAVMPRSDGSQATSYAEIGYKSGHIKDGCLQYDHGIMTLATGLNIYGFGFDVYSYHGEKSVNGNKFHEIDYSFNYSGYAGDFDYRVSLDFWTSPNTGSSFDDMFVDLILGYDGWWVRPEVDLRLALHGQQGYVAKFKVSKEFALLDGLTFGLYDYVSYSSGTACSGCCGVGICSDGFLDTQIGAELKYNWSDAIVIRAGAAFNVLLDKGLRNSCRDPNGTCCSVDGHTEHFIYYCTLGILF